MEDALRSASGSHGYFFGYCHVLHVLDVDFPDKALEVILDYVMDMEIREEFYSFFNQLSDIYEIISPNDFLRYYINNFNTLTRIP